MPKPKVILLCPTPRDLHHLNSPKMREHYEVIPFGTYSDHPADFDVSAFFREAQAFFEKNLGIQGILGPGDYPESILASLLSEKFSLFGPTPESVFFCQHKYYSRLKQKEVVPAVVPDFFAVPLSKEWKEEDIPLPFPFFVKPAKGVLSLFSRPVENFGDFFEVLQEARQKLPAWVSPFNQLLKQSGLDEKFPLGGECLLAEELITGYQVTLEGYVHHGELQLIDIVDSLFYPGTRSFERFQCPSALSVAVQEEMVDLSRNFLKAIDFDHCIFNIEFIYDRDKNRLRILEVNSRIAHQFAGMMEAIHGCNTYEILIDLALGQKPNFKRFAGNDRTAASFVLRAFEDQRVDSIPSPEDLSKIHQRFPKAHIENLVSAGRRLSDHFRQDTESYRYAIVNLSAPNEENLFREYEEIKKKLSYRFSK